MIVTALKDEISYLICVETFDSIKSILGSKWA